MIHYLHINNAAGNIEIRLDSILFHKSDWFKSKMRMYEGRKPSENHNLTKSLGFQQNFFKTPRLPEGVIGVDIGICAQFLTQAFLIQGHLQNC